MNTRTATRTLRAAFFVFFSLLWAKGIAAEVKYPLKVSENGRYLIDARGTPFLMAGESPQAMMVNCSPEEAAMFFDNRRSHGFNTVWINLLCRKGTGGRADGSMYDGLAPFTAPDDLAMPNEAYFARCEQIMELAAKNDYLVLLDPCETIDHIKLMVDNGPDKCRAFGQYLGKRFKRFDNLIWMSGNDFQSWKDPASDRAALAVARGIRDEDPHHLQTVELNYLASTSRDDPAWEPLIGLSAAYIYYPPYVQILKDYNRRPAKPVFMVESDYEFERDSTPAVLRRIEYWSILSGATGQLYGNAYTWPFSAGWKDKLDTPGAVQFANVKKLFEPRPWHLLVPDQKHQAVTAGYGTFDGSETPGSAYGMTSDYIAAARTPDGRLIMAFLPTRRTVTVDMAQLRYAAFARWFDPSSGAYLAIDGSPLPNTGEHNFIPPGNNADGDGDWVLILETSHPGDADAR
jgi:hypothetical protein